MQSKKRLGCKNMKQLLLYSLFFVCSTVVAQKKLEYRFSVGDTFTVQQEAKQLITQDIGGVDQIIENELKGIMQFSVTNKTAESYTLSMSFKRLKMLMTSPSLGELLNADTNASDSTDITNSMFKGILNIPVTILMETSGKIISVSGGDTLIAAMLTSAGISDPELIETSKEQLEKQFGPEALSNSLEQMTYFYPDQETSSATEWSNSYSGAMSADNNWKRNTTSDNELIVSGTASTTMSSIDDTIVMTLSGTQQTMITINPKNGLFKNITITGKNQGTTVFKAQNMSIPTQINSTITYKILK